MSKTKNPLRLDANEEVFFTRELEHIKIKQYEVKHKPLRAKEFIPVSSEATAGADQITIRYYDIVGLAKIVHDYATDFPRVDTYGTEKKFPVKSVGASYGYSVKEIRRAAEAGVPLDARRAMAAQRSIDERIDSIAWLGDAESGLFGLLNYPGVSSYTIPATGNQNGGTNSKLWIHKTPDQIIADVTGLLNAVVVVTNGKEQPNTLILPLAKYNLLAFTRLGSNSDKTILAYLKENMPMLTSISWVNELAGIGAGSTDRIMVYVKDPEYVTLEIPQEFEQFPAERENLSYSIPCHAETAGVINYYPLSMAVGDGA